MHVKIKEMFSLQSTFNKSVDCMPPTPNQWIEAAVVELGEFIEHLGYKWWKTQTPNIPAAKMEIVDILHFALSHTLSVCEGNIPSGYLYGIADIFDNTGNVPNTNKERMEALALLSSSIQDEDRKNSEEMYDVPSRMGIWKCVARLASMMDITFDELYDMYLNKNVLNHLRQQMGYNKGCYVKVHNGIEDNDLLVGLSGTYEERLVKITELYIDSRILESFSLLESLNDGEPIKVEDLAKFYTPKHSYYMDRIIGTYIKKYS